MLRRLFGKRKDEKQNTTGDVLFPKQTDMSLVERFVKKFTEDGGRFIYVEDADNLQSAVEFMKEKEGWTNSLIFDKELQPIQALFSESVVSSDEKTVWVSPCHFLLASNAKVMISSQFTGRRSISDLPKHRLFIASVQQVVESMREGLAELNRTCKSKMPDQITYIGKASSYDNDDMKDIQYFLILTEG